MLRQSKTSSTLREQLASRPVRRPDVTTINLGDGARVVVPVEPRRWSGWLLRVPGGATKKFEFDALGKFVWDQCDGRTSVRRIARRLSRTYRVSDREAHVATTAFLQTLAKRGLIAVAARL